MSKPAPGQSLPYTTPSGYTYRVPTDWHSLQNLVMNYLQSIVECWDEAECPPDPFADRDVARLTWNLLVRAKDRHPYD